MMCALGVDSMPGAVLRGWLQVKYECKNLRKGMPTILIRSSTGAYKGVSDQVSPPVLHTALCIGQQADTGVFHIHIPCTFRFPCTPRFYHAEAVTSPGLSVSTVLLQVKMREVISIHIGQAGIQVGNACWELYCLVC